MYARLFVAGALLLVLTPFVMAANESTLVVTSPTAGQVIQSDTVRVEFELDDFTLVPSTVPLDEAGKRPDANRPGEGHLHLMLDLQPLVVWERNEPYTFTDVPPGEHHLTIELVNNDHSPLSPPVVQIVHFRTTIMMPDTGTDGALSPSTERALLVVCLFVIAMAGFAVRRRFA
jgi:hypothetical protein